MNDGNEYNEEFKNTGHLYGYFTVKQSQDTQVDKELSCPYPLLKQEYDEALSQLHKVMSISSFSEILSDVNGAFQNVLSEIDNIDTDNFNKTKTLRTSFESFIEVLVKAKTHFANQLDIMLGPDVAEAFENDISTIYDSGDSYALIYKLRNVCQHDGRLPLRLNSELDDEGLSQTHITLDGEALLNGRSAKYLNSKVKKFISVDPNIDIFFHVVVAYDQVAGLMHRFLKSVIIDESCVSACIQFINVFLSLEEPTDILQLTELKNIENDSSDGLSLTHSQLSLEYLCKLLSAYLKERPNSLFSYWGQSVDPRVGKILPGLFNLIGPEYFADNHIINIGQINYIWAQRSLSFTKDSSEMSALLIQACEPKPNPEQIKDWWSKYQTILKGVKIINSLINEASSDSSLSTEVC